MKDPEAAWPDRDLFVHGGRWDNGKVVDAKFTKVAVRTQRWRFVDNQTLYDIAVDAGETTDVARQHPEIIETLRRSFDQGWDSAIPLMVNEGLPRVAPENQPFAIRYAKQLEELGIPAWEPPAF